MTLPGLVALPDEVLDEARAILANVELLLANAPTPVGMPPAENRALDRAQMQPRRHDAVDRVVSALDRSVTVRAFTADVADGVYFHIHGGAWTAGEYDQQDERLFAFARACNVAVVSVQYRLAPEHPFPACAEDCEVAAAWLYGAMWRLSSQASPSMMRA